jgi:hypothetical protein
MHKVKTQPGFIVTLDRLSDADVIATLKDSIQRIYKARFT